MSADLYKALSRFPSEAAPREPKKQPGVKIKSTKPGNAEMLVELQNGIETPSTP